MRVVRCVMRYAGSCLATPLLHQEHLGSGKRRKRTSNQHPDLETDGRGRPTIEPPGTIGYTSPRQAFGKHRNYTRFGASVLYLILASVALVGGVSACGRGTPAATPTATASPAPSAVGRGQLSVETIIINRASAILTQSLENLSIEEAPTGAPPDLIILADATFVGSLGNVSVPTMTMGEGPLSNYLKMARRHCRRNHRSAHASCNTPR